MGSKGVRYNVSGKERGTMWVINGSSTIWLIKGEVQCG